MAWDDDISSEDHSKFTALLHDAAPPPRASLDLPDVRRRAGRVRTGLRARKGVAILAVVALAVPASTPLLDRLTRRSIELAPATQPQIPPPSEVPQGPPEPWWELPEAPLTPRLESSIVWTGREVIVWGGAAGEWVPLADGAAYDRGSDTWHPIAPAPIARYSANAVWTGHEMLVWGGFAESQEALTSGAAYDPSTDTWRLLPQGPTASRTASTVVWTGTEMIVWGGYGDVGGDGSAEGAAYDPATDAWRPLADAPLEPRFYHGATWTGELMVVWGGAIGDGGEGSEYADGASYHPGTDTWSMLPNAGIEARSDAFVIWTGEEVLVLGGSALRGSGPQQGGAAYDPTGNAWRTIDNAPLASYQTAAWTGEQLVVYDGETSTGAAYGPTSETWVGLPGNVPTISSALGVAMDESVVLWSGGVPGGWVYDPRSMPSPNQLNVSPPSSTPAADISPSDPNSATVPEEETAFLLPPLPDPTPLPSLHAPAAPDDPDPMKRGGAAAQLIACAGPIANAGTGREGLGAGSGPTPEEGLRSLLDTGWFGLPLTGWSPAAQDDTRTLYLHLASGVAKAAVVVALPGADQTASDHTEGWGAESWATCDPSEYADGTDVNTGTQVWEDRDGQRVPTTTLSSNQGAEHCGWQDITFLELGGVQYVGVPVADEEATSAPVTVPPDAVDSGYRRGGIELWLAADETAAYLIGPAGVEHWPAAREPMRCR